MEKLVPNDGADKGSPILPTVSIKSVKSTTAFRTEVTRIAQEQDCSLMDAVLFYCDHYGVEIETVGAVIKKLPELSQSIEKEARELNFFKNKKE